MALKLRPAGAAIKIEDFHRAFRPKRRPRADSFKRWLDGAILEYLLVRCSGTEPYFQCALIDCRNRARMHPHNAVFAFLVGGSGCCELIIQIPSVDHLCLPLGTVVPLANELHEGSVASLSQ
jgi:hypothetical protein